MGKRKRGGIQGGVVASVIGAMAAATLYLSTNQFNHHMNPVGGTKTPFYDAMIEALSTETDYSLLAHEPVDNNPILYQTLKSFTLSQTHVNKPKADQARFDSAVKFVFSIIIDLLIRLLNPQVWCYSIMLLTLAAVRSMTNTTFWSLLVKCRILYSKKVGEEVARDLGEKVKCKWPSWASKQLAVAVFDNCAYRLRSNHEHVDEARRNRFYETINWFYSFATNVDDDALLAEGGMVWDANGANAGVQLLVGDEAGHKEFKEGVYAHFMNLALDEEGQGPVELLYRPDAYIPPLGPTPMLMQPHISDAGTHSYDDVEKCLGMIYQELIVLKGLKLVFVYGDQQSYSRMVWLKRMRPEQYKWLIPMPGEFHFKVHALMAIHCLWYMTLVLWVIDHTGMCERSIDEEWTNVELYNRHEFFYETLIVGIVTYLVSVVPRALLLDRAQLFEQAANNAGAMVLLRFLFDFALPWLALRKGIRCNNSDTLDKMWAITLAWFRAVGKTNYGPMAVDVLYVNCSLSQALRNISIRHRTMSLKGNPGSNVPWDHGNEEMNKLIKCGLGTAVAAHLINPYILMLNGIRFVEARLNAIFGSEPGDARSDIDPDKESYYKQYTRTEQQDIDAIAAALTVALGDSHADLFAPKPNNPFRRGPGVPWNRVSEKTPTNQQYAAAHLQNKEFGVEPVF